MFITELIKLVREMRTAQKTYFKSRFQSDLLKSKDLERRVDKALAEDITMLGNANDDSSMTEAELQARMELLDNMPIVEPDAGDLFGRSES